MRTLGDAWHEAYTFLDALPYSRTPVLTLSYSKNINGHAPTSNAYLSLQMTETERKGGELRFWSTRAYDRADPIAEIDEVVAAARVFLFGPSDDGMMTATQVQNRKGKFGHDEPDPFS